MPSIIIKSANQAKTTDTALADDSELVMSLTAQKLYEIEAVIKFGYGATPTVSNLKFAWNFTGTLIFANGKIVFNDRTHPAPAWRDANNIGEHYGFQGALLPNATVVGTIVGTAGTGLVLFLGYLKVGDTGGTFSFQWSQLTSSANATTIYQGSSLYVAERVAPS